MYRFLPILLFAHILALTTEDIYDNSYALIIGINMYKNVSNLSYAVDDANSIASLLEKFNFSSHNIKILINESATYSNIRNSLFDISLSAKENDRVLIYFAGHGMTDDLPDGGEMGYLLPTGAKRDELFTTSIPMDDLKRISSMSQSKHMLFLIDACYSGLAATQHRSLSPSTSNYIEKITKDKSRQIITAGGKDEEVVEKSEWGHSAFTKNLIKELENYKADFNNDGYITAQELGTYLNDKVTIDSDYLQTPILKRYSSDEGEFVFINNVEKIIINDSKINFVDTTNTINYDILAKKIADELSNSSNEKSKEFYRILISPYLGAGNLPYGIGGVSLGFNFSKRSQLSLQYQIRGNESTYPYSQSDYNAINIGLTRYWGKKLNKYISLGIGPSFLEYRSASSNYSFDEEGGDMFIEIGTIIKSKTYFNPSISIRLGYSNEIGGITTEDDIKYSLEGGYFMILGHFDLIKLYSANSWTWL